MDVQESCVDTCVIQLGSADFGIKIFSKKYSIQQDIATSLQHWMTRRSQTINGYQVQEVPSETPAVISHRVPGKMAVLSYNSSLRIQVRHTQHPTAAQKPALFLQQICLELQAIFWIHPNWRILSIKSFPLTVGVPAHSSSFCPLNCNVEESWVNISASKQFHRKTRAKTHGWTASGPPTQHRHRWYFKTLQQHFWMTIRGPNGLSGIQVECSFISVTWSIFHWNFQWSLQSTVSPEPKRQVDAVVGLLLIKCKGLKNQKCTNVPEIRQAVSFQGCSW